MKRIPELLPLSKEHIESLALARQCQEVATTGSDAEIESLCEEVKTAFTTKWERHFHAEEDTIFTIAETIGGEIADLCAQLKLEHDHLRGLHQAMIRGHCSVLKSFGELLESHTIMEEKQLFPLVESTFDPGQLQTIGGAHA